MSRPSLRAQVVITAIALVFTLSLIPWMLSTVDRPARSYSPAMPCARDEVYVWTDFDLNRAKCVAADDHARHKEGASRVGRRPFSSAH